MKAIEFREHKHCGHQVSVTDNGNQWITSNIGRDFLELIIYQNKLDKYVESVRQKIKESKK